MNLPRKTFALPDLTRPAAHGLPPREAARPFAPVVLVPSHRASAAGPNPGDADATLPGDPEATVAPVSEPARPASAPAPRRYVAEAIVGSGGLGEVLRARDVAIARTVAVKRLRPEVRNADNVERFAEEVRTLGALEHPNIVPIHDVGEDVQGPFLVMKYVDGQTLEEVIEKLRAGDPEAHAQFTFERRVEIFEGLLEAVAYAHARGVLHRDIKPANVMVGPFGEVTLMDWGLATSRAVAPTAEVHQEPATRGRSLTRAGAILGTPGYMSPEQARGEALTAKSDLYSLSVLFYELLSLEHYLGDCTTIAAMLAGVERRTPTHPSLRKSPHQPVVPMDLGYFVLRGLAKDPAARPASATEMLSRLHRRREGLIEVSCVATFVMRAASSLSRTVTRHPRGALLTLFGLAVVALLTVGWLAFRALAG
jgi:serine/threonine-protein kinase